MLGVLPKTIESCVQSLFSNRVLCPPGQGGLDFTSAYPRNQNLNGFYARSDLRRGATTMAGARCPTKTAQPWCENVPAITFEFRIGSCVLYSLKGISPWRAWSKNGFVMVLGLPKRCAQKVVKKWSQPGPGTIKTPLKHH